MPWRWSSKRRQSRKRRRPGSGRLYRVSIDWLSNLSNDLVDEVFIGAQRVPHDRL